jgi:hypothetical protein
MKDMTRATVIFGSPLAVSQFDVIGLSNASRDGEICR